MKMLKSLLLIVILAFVIAFLTGFLQSTKFEFIIYLSYFILFLLGIKLLEMTLKSEATGIAKLFLLVTACSLTIYFFAFIIAVVGNILFGTGITEIMELLEGILYITSLMFLIGAIGSIILLKEK